MIFYAKSYIGITSLSTVKLKVEFKKKKKTIAHVVEGKQRVRYFEFI